MARATKSKRNTNSQKPIATGPDSNTTVSGDSVGGATDSPSLELGPTTRKTIEIPESQFYEVKMHALKRRLREKDLWAEIVAEYLANHPLTNDD